MPITVIDEAVGDTNLECVELKNIDTEELIKKSVGALLTFIGAK